MSVQDSCKYINEHLFILENIMDAHIERHQPLITARLIFAPKALPPPPIITARMEFPLFSIRQHGNTRERSLTPARDTPNHAPTPKRHPTPQRDATPARK